MGRNRNYSKIDPRAAVDLDALRTSREQEEIVEKLMKRKARNQLAMAFAQGMVHGLGDAKLDVEHVATQAYDLASAVLDKSEQLDASDPIDTSMLANAQVAR